MPLRDVVGHRRLISLLARAIRRGTLPPSLILAGPTGVGKRLTAVAIAQALNCTNPQEIVDFGPDGARPSGPTGPSGPGEPIGIDACGECASCSRIARGVHGDVTLIEPGDTGTIKIDQIRDVVDRAGYKPFEGKRRVVIIDDAEEMVTAAQNALLKTLEEPTASSAFLLVTSRPDMLLDTVRSRCPRLRFQPLDAGEVAKVLVGLGRDKKEAATVAANADGSIRQALDISAGDLVDARDLAVRVLGETAAGDNRRRAEGAKDLLAKTGSGGASDREQLASHLRAIAAILRDVEVLAAGAESAGLANPDARPAIERLTAFRGQRGVSAYETIDRALAALDANAGVKVVADWVAMSL
jgi:DNA polymerase-3 subunit delta'